MPESKSRTGVMAGGTAPSPRGFSDLFITKDFAINHFGSAHSKGVRGCEMWICGF